MNRTQVTNTLLLIRPAHFGFNEETAENNAFQQNLKLSPSTIQKKALEEFDQAVKKLEAKDISVLVIEDSKSPEKPDAIFPNNWFSTHQEGIIVTYPMFSELRRDERRFDIIADLIEKKGYDTYLTLAFYEQKEQFLEGTGSLILDRVNRKVFACKSQRTMTEPFQRFCELLNYDGFLFEAEDDNGIPIYHTNVMMAFGVNSVIVCLDAITSEDRKESLLHTLKNLQKQIIAINFEQMKNFAGNMLQVKNGNGDLFWVMSQAAHNSLRTDQLSLLKNDSELLVIDIPTIEKIGGGSIRCMMAEVF